MNCINLYDLNLNEKNLSSRELGFVFEDNIHTILSQSKYLVYKEKDIIKKYGEICYGIDHLIITNYLVITIQDKWKNSKPTINDVNHFIASSERIKKIHNLPLVSIYLSKNNITSYAEKILNFENNNTSNTYINISNVSYLDLIKELTQILYNYGIYFYENDNSVIMLNNIY